jgi:Protein of unknown function (DUF1302)
VGRVLGICGAVILALQLWGVATAWSIQTTIGGRSVDLDASLSLREVIEENGSTKHDRTRERLRLRAAVSLTDWLRFDSTTVGTNGGPTMKADRSGLYNWRDAFQDVSPVADFQEAYFDVRLPSVDLRLGLQKVAWGKLDRTQPNDLINTFNYTDPLMDEEDERKIGVPALQASYFFPESWSLPEESRFTAVWVAKYVPYRFPLADCVVENGVSRCDAERWFPPAAVPDTTIQLPESIVEVPGGLAVPIGFQVRNSPPPAFRLANSDIGLRYSALVQDVDFALYYYHGFDPQPAFNLTATASGQPDPNPPLFVKNLSASTTLTPNYQQVDSWGADLAYAFDRVTVRGEGAFVRGRPFSRDLRFLVTDPATIAPEIAQALKALAQGAGSAPVELPPGSVTRDAIEWGVGGDYVYKGYTLLLQVNQTDVLHNDVQLLIKDVDTRLLANLRKSFFSDTLKAQLVAVQAIESDYTIVRPRLTYSFTDHVSAEVGYLFIAGRAQSVGGEFRRNGQGWVEVEYRL